MTDTLSSVAKGYVLNTEKVLFVLSQAVIVPDMHSFYVYCSQISSPSYMTHFTSHYLQESPLLCLLDHVFLSGFGFGSVGSNWGVVLRVVNEVCMCVRADLYLPHVQEQETSCLLFCLSLILFCFCLSQEACSLPKHKDTLFNTLMFLLHLKEPELQMPISWWKKERFLGFVSLSRFRKKINRLNTLIKMHEMHCGDFWVTVTEGQNWQVLYMLVSADSPQLPKRCLKLLGPTKNWGFAGAYLAFLLQMLLKVFHFL